MVAVFGDGEVYLRVESKERRGVQRLWAARSALYEATLILFFLSPPDKEK